MLLHKFVFLYLIAIYFHDNIKIELSKGSGSEPVGIPVICQKEKLLKLKKKKHYQEEN